LSLPRRAITRRHLTVTSRVARRVNANSASMRDRCVSALARLLASGGVRRLPGDCQEPRSLETEPYARFAASLCEVGSGL